MNRARTWYQKIFLKGKRHMASPFNIAGFGALLAGNAAAARFAAAAATAR